MGKISAETCSICHENLSKYRCPRCSAPYCSLACNKAHRSGVSSVDGEQANPPCTGKRALSGHERHPDSKSNSQTARSNVVGSDRRDDGDEGDGVGLSKRPRIANAVDTAGGDAVVEAVTTACVRKGRDQWRGGREDREEEEWQMSADQRSRLLGCMWLKAALRDPKLQGLLSEIDKADDREKALAYHRTSTQFGEFMDKMLLEIEEYRKGGIDEPDLVAADP